MSDNTPKNNKKVFQSNKNFADSGKKSQISYLEGSRKSYKTDFRARESRGISEPNVRNMNLYKNKRSTYGRLKWEKNNKDAIMFDGFEDVCATS